MNTKSSPSAYRYCIVRLSTVAVSTFVPALNVLSTTLPLNTFLRVVRTNAPPLPGLTCWNSTTVQRSPSRLRTSPFLRSFVVAMACLDLHRGSGTRQVYRYPHRRPMSPPTSAGRSARARGDVFQRQPVAVDAEAADHAGGHGGDDRVVPEVLARVDVGDVHLDQRPGDQGAGVAQCVGVVRPGARVEHHG